MIGTANQASSPVMSSVSGTILAPRKRGATWDVRVGLAC